MPSVTADLQQNIIVTLYLLFSHNYIALAYFVGMIIGIILSIVKPSRFTTFIFLGFAILLFSYEYDKHIIEGLRQQTIQSLITINPHQRLRRIIDLTLTEILPIVLYVGGWALLFFSIIAAGMSLGRKKDTEKKE